MVVPAMVYCADGCQFNFRQLAVIPPLLVHWLGEFTCRDLDDLFSAGLSSAVL